VSEIDAASMLFPAHTERPEMYVRATKKMWQQWSKRARRTHALIIIHLNDLLL
jgi:hypothetical protein